MLHYEVTWNLKFKLNGINSAIGDIMLVSLFSYTEVDGGVWQFLLIRLGMVPCLAQSPIFRAAVGLDSHEELSALSPYYYNEFPSFVHIINTFIINGI